MAETVERSDMAEPLERTHSAGDAKLLEKQLANGDKSNETEAFPSLPRANTLTHSKTGGSPILTSQQPRKSITEPLNGDSTKSKRKWSLLPGTLRPNSSGKLKDAIPEDESSDLESSGSSSDDDDDEPAMPTDAFRRRRTMTKVPFDNYPQKTNSAIAPAPSRFHLESEHIRTKGKVSKHDGRLKLSVNEKTDRGVVAKVLDAGIRHHLGLSRELNKPEAATEGMNEVVFKHVSKEEFHNPPRLNIVIMVIGSRGDIQPFIKIGKILKEQYGHRVRLATHPAFKKFIEDDCELEFFSVGGDPAELMAFMVKNPGLIPSFETVKEGEIGRRRASMFEMFQGFWRACVNATDDESDIANKNLVGDKEPFLADVIIANPPSFAHIHCAERLGCPLHMIFTFPYSPTTQFPHPLANIKKSNLDWEYTNFMSYALVDIMTWQGLGDLVNDFRTKTLGLDALSTIWAPGMLYRLHVAHTYLWSPELVPKPKDWGPEIDIAGFVFLDLASKFKPPEDLAKFLDAGDPPIYIGFGSIVVDDPDSFTEMIFEAAKKAGVRALVNKGWGGFGGKNDAPDHIFMLDNTPHDWLFPRCKAVVHHGGAGTTAIGLKCAKPTMIVPFFGDQPFWGDMVAKAGAGAKECIPYKQLDVDKFAEGIKQCLTEEAQANVQKIADGIAEEGDGAENAVKSFLSKLPVKGNNSLYCSIFHDKIAAWQVKGTEIRLSALAAEILVENRQIAFKQLRLLRRFEWNDFSGPGGPITGLSGVLVKNVAGFGKSIMDGSHAVTKDLKYYYVHEKKKRRYRRKTLETQKKKEVQPVNTDPKADPGPSEPVEALPRSTGQNAEMGALLKEEAKSPQTAKARTEQIKREERMAMPARVDTQTSAMSADAVYKEKLKQDAKLSIKKPMSYVVKGPVDVLIGLGLGFHNLPRIWHDETVRRPLRIHNFRTGYQAARSEIAWQAYDAVTGVFTQPYGEAKKEYGARKIVGGTRGLGKGVAGLLTKPWAGLILPLPYVARGALREMSQNRTPVKTMRRARIAQGRSDGSKLDEEERKTRNSVALERWGAMKESVPVDEEATKEEES